MDARSSQFNVALVLTLLSTMLFHHCLMAETYQANSRNCVVFAPDARLARQASQLAEQYRKELSLDWLGYEIEPWRERCPIKIYLDPHAGGQTSFAFVQNQTGRSEPISWEMEIYGPVDRLLDAVLPHEITHTIFATHFGRPLPRWADEGACTTVEHVSERAKNHRMLISILTGKPSRGIPFNRMFTMKQYPHDILPLYAQGYSVARYLIGQKGRQHFVKYIERGMSLEQSNYDTRSWDKATSEFYGYEDLSDLQIKWLTWLRSGSPAQQQVPQIAQATNTANTTKAASPIPETTTSQPVGGLGEADGSDSKVAAASFVDTNSTYSIANGNTMANDNVDVGASATNADANRPNPVADVVERTSPASSTASVGGKLNTWYARQSRAKQAVDEGPAGRIAQLSDPFVEFRPGSLKRAKASPTSIGRQLHHDHQSATGPRQTIWR